jgi:hypothetical protein
MDAAAINAEHVAARDFLIYLKVEQATANTNLLAADTMLSADPESQRLKSNLARAVGLLAQADGDVAAQVAAISNLRAAAAPTPQPTVAPAARKLPREQSPPPTAKKPKLFCLANAARTTSHPQDGWLDSSGKTHLAHLAEARALDQRLGWTWALVDGIAAMLGAGGITAAPTPEDGTIGDATLVEEEPSPLTAEQIRTALRDVASSLEAPSLALLQVTLEEGITLNVRHTHGAAVARAFCSTDPLEALDSDHARKLAQAIKNTKSAKPRSGDEHPPPRDRRWPRDTRQRDREPRRSPPREYRRENDRMPRDAPQPRAPPNSVQCRRCGKDGHFARDCKRP